MFDIPISKMDDKQLRGAVQLLYDELALFKRKYEDAIYNLDEDNFSRGFVLTQDKAKAIVKLTAARLETRLLDAEGDISELTQTASRFNLRLSDAENGVAEISATVAGLTFSVSNGESSSKLKLMSNGVELASATIRITGMVTFDDLEGEGSTVINGANISTGVIEAIGIDSCTIVGGEITGTTIIGSDIELDYSANADKANGILFKYSSLVCGYIKLIRSSAAPTLYFGTNNEGVRLKIICDDDMSIEADRGCVYIYGDDYVTLDSATEVNIHLARLITADDNAWEFKDDGIYFANEKVFAL